MSWDWLAGGADFLTGGLTDFDNKGSSGYNWMTGGLTSQFDPIGGGSDKRWGPSTSTWADALKAAQSWTSGSGASGGGGGSPGSFSYDRGTISNSPTFTTSTFGDDTWISQPAPMIVLGPDNPEPPVYNSSGSGSSGGGGSSALDTFSKGLGIIGTIAGICDIRVKTDISPLETTDITDDLAEVAFFVKGLRECS